LLPAPGGADAMARVVLLLITALLIGTAIGVHTDGYDLGWWLMVCAGFFGSWAFVPLSGQRRIDGDR
jgi:hypothetical protein